MELSKALVLGLAALIFASLLVLAVAALWPSSGKRERIKQIAHFGPARTTRTRPEPQGGGLIARTALAATASVVRSGGAEDAIKLRLQRAGIRMRPAEWVLLRVCGAIVGAAAFFGTLFGLYRWATVVIGLVLGWLATSMYRIVRTDRREQTFAEQLPDALQLIAGSLKAGFSLTQALDAAVRESPQPVSEEFGRAVAENRLGVDLPDALEQVAHRANNEDLRWAVMAIRIQRDVGGNLAEVLQTAVDTMRERTRLRRHVRTLSAEGRFSAAILIGLPVVLGIFMFTFRRAYLMPLFSEPIGVALVLAAALLFVIGIFWISRVVKVSV